MLHRGGFRTFDNGDMGGPDLGFSRAAAATRGDDDTEFRQVVRDHEHLGKRRMRQIGRLRRKDQFGIRGQVDLARAPARVGQGDAPRLGVILGGHNHFGRRGQGPGAAGECGMMFAEHGAVLTGDRPGGLHACRPAITGLDIAQKHKRSQRIQRRICPPAGDRQIAPTAVACTGWGQHHAITAIGQQMCCGRFRRRIVEPSDLGRIKGISRTDRDLFGPGAGHGDIAGDPLLQQQLDRLHHRQGMEPRPEQAVLHHIGDGGNGHALMMGHETADNRMDLPFGQPAGGEIHSFVKAEPPFGPQCCQTRVVDHGSHRINHRGQPRGIGGDDPVLPQPAFQAQPRHPKVGILIGHFKVAGIVAGFRYAPGNAVGVTIGLLPRDDQRRGLRQNRPGRCTHHQRWHQVFEHRTRP